MKVGVLNNILGLRYGAVKVIMFKKVITLSIDCD